MIGRDDDTGLGRFNRVPACAIVETDVRVFDPLHGGEGSPLSGVTP